MSIAENDQSMLLRNSNQLCGIEAQREQLHLRLSRQLIRGLRWHLCVRSVDALSHSIC
jgi:hypothetical protein